MEFTAAVVHTYQAFCYSELLQELEMGISRSIAFVIDWHKPAQHRKQLWCFISTDGIPKVIGLSYRQQREQNDQSK